MIVHTVHTMTVREYSQYEADRNPKLLLRLRWIPVRWFKKGVNDFIAEFNKLFNENGEDFISKQIEQMVMYNRVQIFRTLYEAFQVHVGTKTQLDFLKQKAGLKIKEDPALAKYIELAEQYSGIRITDLNTLQAFYSEVERKIDKYNEMYRNTEVVKPDTNILKLYFVCCSVLEQSPGTGITLYEFSIFKKQAEERSRQIENRMKQD